MEICSNAVAIGLLAWQARHAGEGPSLPRLKRWLALLALAWLSLILALAYPLMLLPYVALFGIGLPLASSQKSSLTIQGMTQGQGDRESQSMARSILLVASRIACLLLCLGLTGLAGTAERAVALMALSLIHI